MIRTILLIILFSSIIFSQTIPKPSIEFAPKKYICYKSGEILTIDGDLSESSWEKAEWTDDFVDIEGQLKPMPRFCTRAKMLWDENYFYVAAELFEPDIWGTLKNRDDIIFYDNDFEVFIDPDGNTHGYVEFEMNALNTVWDLILIQPYRDINKAALHQFDIKGLKSGVKVYGTLNEPGDKDSSWTVEIAFPWKGFEEVADIPMPPKDTDQWRINFSRVEWKTEVKNGQYQKQINPETGKPYPEDNWVWTPQGVVNMHYPEMWGYVQFTNEIVGGKQVPFVENNEEKAKWYLREIYYAEKYYFEVNKKFTTDLKELNLETKNISGFIAPPVIECTSGMFEASIKSINGKYKLNIDDNGLTWKTIFKE
ncbi:MAG: carbohydrate-binding family 9-like protein [Ignavibacteria bacterium]